MSLLHCCTLFLALTLSASLAHCQSLTHLCIYYPRLSHLSAWWQDLEQKITRCKNKHPCVRIATGTTEVYDNGTYRCDKCFKDYPDDAERWHCVECSWDICYDCTCEHARERKHCEECGGSPPEAATASSLAGFSVNIQEGWHVNDNFRMARNAAPGEDKVGFEAPEKPTRSATMHTRYIHRGVSLCVSFVLYLALCWADIFRFVTDKSSPSCQPFLFGQVDSLGLF